jgi:thioredoxin-dependent peroxiredoxin
MKLFGTVVMASLALGLAFSSLRAEDTKVGAKAPTFEAPDETGKIWKSSDHVGKKVIVVYFYPADFTGGCTAQACSFRDDFKKLVDKGVEVVGVSGDTVKTHEAFKQFHKLPFTLLADEKGDIAKKFGVPVSEGAKTAKGTGLDGKEEIFKRNVTTSRWTFVIDKEGKIIHKNDKVKAADDSKQILELVEKLK